MYYKIKPNQRNENEAEKCIHHFDYLNANDMVLQTCLKRYKMPEKIMNLVTNAQENLRVELRAASQTIVEVVCCSLL